MKQKQNKEETIKQKQLKLLDKVKQNLKKRNRDYIKKRHLKKKFKNSQSFFNFKEINKDGHVLLKNGEVAKIISVEAIDLSLSSNQQRRNFFNQLKYLYQIKNLDLRIYKLDERIDLSVNKDYYLDLVKEYEDDEVKLKFLYDRISKIDELEQDELTTTSKYYFVITAKNENILEKLLDDIEQICFNITPKLDLNYLEERIDIYQFLINFYCSQASIQQLLYNDFGELIVPYYLNESIHNMKFDSEEIQVVMLKNLPLFVDDLFLEELFNVPDVRCCIHVRDTVNNERAINNIDNNYEMNTAERITTRKISNATEVDMEQEAIRSLMAQVKSGDEKIKEVVFTMIIKGTKKQRDEKLNELKKIAMIHKIKLDIPRMRQYEGWQSYDISTDGFQDYENYLPTYTLATAFPLTVTYFNDSSGYMLGIDNHTGLPIFFDLFKKNKIRPASNLAIIASTGGGKSFTLKKMITNEISRGNKIFIFDAEGEYKNLVNRNKGEYIDLYSTSGGIINPLQVRYLPSDEEERSDSSNGLETSDCPLPKHLSSLETFLKCAFDEIKEEEIVVLMDLVERLYQRFGITKNTPLSTFENLQNTDYPIFTDLIEYLPDYKKLNTNKEKNKILERLEILLERFKVGTDSMLFNGYTSVDLNANLIAFNIKDLMYSKNKRIITTQLVNLLSYLNNIIVSNQIISSRDGAIKNIAIVIDEFHLYIKNTNNDVILTFEQIARRIRKYHGSFIPTTQSIRDFIGESESVRSATAIFNNCQYQLVGMLKDDDLTTYLKLFYQNPLTDTQVDYLSKAEQGQFLLSITNKRRLRLSVIASPTEQDFMGEE